METLKVINGFNRLSGANLLARASQIITDLALNFSTAPGLADLTAARDIFASALSYAKDGSTYDKAFKNQKKEELVAQLHLMGYYVMLTAAGNRALAVSSGFTFAKEPQPAPAVTKPENLQLENGLNAGELKLSFDKVPGARSYMYQFTPDPLGSSNTWSSETGTVRKAALTGLQSGARYWCRVAALGIDGQAVYSDPVSRLVQ